MSVTDASTLQARSERRRSAIAARLAHVRHVMPGLPHGARLAIVGGGRESNDYRAVAAECGFTVVAPPATLDRSHLSLLARPAVRRWALEGWDVLAVAEVSALEAYRMKFSDTEERGLIRIGNFFVKQEYAQPRRLPAAA